MQLKPDQFGRGVVARDTPETQRVLAGHHRHIALVVGCSMGDISDGEHVCGLFGVQIGIDVNATISVVLTITAS